MLSKGGKLFDALRYANAFDMLDKIEPVDLLTSYLRDVEKAGKEVVTKAQGTAASQVPDYMARLQRDADMKLRGAVKTVIKFVRRYGLDSHFFEDKLRKLQQGKEHEEQPEPRTRAKNNESKTSKVNALNPRISKLEQDGEDRKISKNARRKRNRAAKKNAKQEDGKSAAENNNKAQEKEEKEDGNKAAKKKAENIEEREDGKKAAEKKAQEIEEKEDGKKAAEKRAQEKEKKEGGKKDAEKKAKEKEDGNKIAGKKAQEKDAGKKAQEKAGKKDAEKKAREKEDGEKDAEKMAQEKKEQEDGRKDDAEKKAQHKKRQSFEPGYKLSESENYASKRAKHASSNETTRVVKQKAEQEDGKKASEKKAQEKASGLAAGASASVPSIGVQINNERRRHEGNPLAFGTSNLAPIGTSLYSASVPGGPFAVPLSNVAAVNYDGRGQQSYAMNFVEVDKNPIRTSVYGTRDLSNSLAMQNKYNFEGRGEESYKLNLGEIHNNPVRASSYATGVSTNSSATQCHYERRVPELYTSTFGGGNTAGIGSSVYESNPCTIPSGVNHGSHEISLGQSSSFAGQNAVPVEPSGYGSALPTVPPSSVSQGHFERRGSVINKYTFNSG